MEVSERKLMFNEADDELEGFISAWKKDASAVNIILHSPQMDEIENTNLA